MSGIAHVVVDGSNIATEGRSTPSLAQLEGAVEELRREMPDSEVIVVVDATFAHRIDADERGRFEKAALRGEYVYPPAGAIGRGDAFLLRIAQKIDAIVLSNDSFQEFHGEHDWLFERGRLLGATPVPGVGWIFVPRTPVRGAKSRIAVRDAERSKSKVEKAIAVATREAVEPDAQKGQRKGKKKAAEAGAADGKGAGRQPRAVNDPLTFISFVAEHPLGVSLEGEVENFTSHGAVVRVGEMHCYVPLSGLGNPPPRSAREVLRKDERRTFVLTALDPQRRGVELSLPEVAVVSGRPSEETVEAEVAMTKDRRRRRAAGEPASVPSAVSPPPAEPVEVPAAASQPPAAEAPPPAPAARGSRSRKRPPAAGAEAPPAEPPAPEPSPAARGSRSRKRPPAPSSEAPAAATAKPSRSRKQAPAPVPAAPAPQPAAPAPPPPEPSPAAKAPRSRKQAPPPGPPAPEVQAATAKAPRSRKQAPAPAPQPPAPAPPPRSRARPPASEAAPPPPAPEPVPAGRAPRARKRQPAAPAPAPAAPPAPAGRSRKRAAGAGEPPPAPAGEAPAPASRSRKAAPRAPV